jgi:hypothetical protein
MISAYQDDAELAKLSLDFVGAAREMIKVLATGVPAGGTGGRPPGDIKDREGERSSSNMRRPAGGTAGRPPGRYQGPGR